MMRNNSFARIAAVALLAIAIAVPSFAARGSADFSHFVAIGDSYGAGFESGTLHERHQVFSWPAVIARQVGLQLCTPANTAADNCFAQPLVSFPGIPGNELTLNATGSGLTVIPGTGAPEMLGFGRPYNNLSVPGFTVGATVALTGASSEPGLSPLILRGLGTEVQQAVAQHPTFIAIWIGGNDFLGAVSNGSPAGLTPTANFTAAYNKMLDDLIAGAPNAGIVVGTLPQNFAAAPLTARLPGILLNPTTGQPVLIGGAPVPLIADLGGGNIGPLPAGSIVLLSALGDLQAGFGIPPQLKTVPPFSLLPHAGEPLKDSQTITPAEQAQFNTRIGEFNTAITAAAAAHNVAVADIKGLFDRFATSATNPIQIGPFVFSNTFATGGIFSFDGVHLSDLGYILFANEYIKAINSAYGTRIPLASIAQVLQNNDPDTASALSNLTISPEVAARMISIFSSATPAPSPVRRRSIH
jgi:lysophospholipase L1-like esterase